MSTSRLSSSDESLDSTLFAKCNETSLANDEVNSDHCCNQSCGIASLDYSPILPHRHARRAIRPPQIPEISSRRRAAGLQARSAPSRQTALVARWISPRTAAKWPHASPKVRRARAGFAAYPPREANRRPVAENRMPSSARRRQRPPRAPRHASPTTHSARPPERHLTAAPTPASTPPLCGSPRSALTPPACTPPPPRRLSRRPPAPGR